MYESSVRSLNEEGFTLAETAIVLTIIATVIGLLVPSLLTIRVSEQARTTTQTLQTVMRAITAYVQSRGCVPCPTRADNASSGKPSFENGSSTASCGVCSKAVGTVPFVSLGIPESMAKDGYGHWLSYAVDTELAKTTYAVIPPQITNGLCQANIPASNRLSVTISGGANQQAAVLILSHGADGHGAYRNQPDTPPNDRMDFVSSFPACAGLAGAERCNADNDKNFVNAAPAAGDDPFDDQMLYLDRNALVTYLGNIACTTSW